MGSVNGVGNVFCPFNLGAEGIKQLFYFPIDAFGELDLLHYLVCTIIQLLFGGDDAEQVQDKCQEKHPMKKNTTVLNQPSSPFALFIMDARFLAAILVIMMELPLAT